MSRKKEKVIGETIYPLVGFKEVWKLFVGNNKNIVSDEYLSDKAAEEEAKKIAELSDERVKFIESNYSGEGIISSGKSKKLSFNTKSKVKSSNENVRQEIEEDSRER